MFASAGRIDRAEEMYRRALSVDAHDGDVHVRLGRILLARGDRSGARIEGDAALRWQPGAAAASDLVARAATGSAR
jgi:Tfp pilus assembly protein PilF